MRMPSQEKTLQRSRGRIGLPSDSTIDTAHRHDTSARRISTTKGEPHANAITGEDIAAVAGPHRPPVRLNHRHGSPPRHISTTHQHDERRATCECHHRRRHCSDCRIPRRRCASVPARGRPGDGFGTVKPDEPNARAFPADGCMLCNDVNRRRRHGGQRGRLLPLRRSDSPRCWRAIPRPRRKCSGSSPSMSRNCGAGWSPIPARTPHFWNTSRRRAAPASTAP